MKVIRLDRRLYGVKSPFYSELLKDIAKETPGVVWHRAARAWVGYADGVMAVVARLQAEGCQVDIRQLPEPASQKEKIDCFLPIADKGLRDYQKFGVRFCVDQGPTGCILADEMSLGKAQPVDEPVLTPTGWRAIGSLRVGDEVIGANGHATKVTGVFPQGTKAVYRLRFSDGTTTRCCKEHLWLVNTALRRWRKRPGVVLSLEEILRRGVVDGAGNRKHFVPVVAPVHFASRSNPHRAALHPYVLGALIANGSLTARHITHHGGEDQREEIARCKQDIRAMQAPRTSALGYARDDLRVALAAVGLIGTVCETKFIPKVYKFASVEDRIALLQGLFDNDGTVDKTGVIVEYNTVSPRLAKDVVFLARSLGAIARLSTRIPYFTYKGERKAGQRDYRVRVVMPEGIVPFRLPRKVERFKPRTTYAPTRSIASAEPDGEAECVCIRVAAEDQLYVTRGFVVTHNTIQTIRAARAFRLKLLVVCPSYARGVWSRPPSSAFPGELAKWWPKALPCAALEGVKAASTIVRPTKKQLALGEGLPCKRGRDSQNYVGLPLHAKVAVVHYEIAYAWVDALLAWGEGRLMVVFDEIHQAGNPRSRMWQALRTLSENAKVSIGLTGTPLQNHIEDLWNVVELVSPGRFSNPLELDRRSFFDYGMRHAGGHPEQVTPEKVVYKWDGKTNQEELKARLEYMILRRTKKSVKLQLPPLERQVIDVEVPPQARVIARAEIFKKSRLARQCLDLAANAKLPKVVELLQRHVEQGLRVVAATHRRNIAEWLCTQMTARKVRSSFVHGGVSFRNRDKRIDAARALRGSSEGHVLCCTMDSTKSSIDLSYADVGVVVEFDWNPATHRQWEARISRFGSTSTRTLFQYVVGRGTTDEIVIERLLEKLRTFDETVGSLDDTFGEDIDTRAKGNEALAELAAAIRKRQQALLANDDDEEAA